MLRLAVISLSLVSSFAEVTRMEDALSMKRKLISLLEAKGVSVAVDKSISDEMAESLYNELDNFDKAGSTMKFGTAKQDKPNEDRKRLIDSSGWYSADKETVLNMHNSYRSELATGNTPDDGTDGTYPTGSNINSLFWDEALESVAQAYSDQCIFVHNDNRGSEFYSYTSQASFDYPSSGIYLGENLAAMWTSDTNVYDSYLTERVDAWWDENVLWHYDDGIFDSDFFNSGAGHFSQMAWADTRYVGCGFSICDDGGTKMYYLCCNYYPGGNYLGSKLYDQGTCTDSTCPADRTTSCQDNLCTGCMDPAFATSGSTSNPTDCNNGFVDVGDVNITTSPPGPTSNPTERPTPVPVGSSYFVCDNGCLINFWYQNDGDCDCETCEDEDSYDCTSCGGCPTYCGSFVSCPDVPYPTKSPVTPAPTGPTEAPTTRAPTKSPITPAPTVSRAPTEAPVTPAPTEAPVTPAPTEDDGFFTCDDGCRIFDSYKNDNWCDCSDCEDEDSWNCRNCDCPTYCGSYEYCDGNGGTDSPTTVCDGTATEGASCNFNVSYMGVTYDSCITTGSDRPWCYVTEEINHETKLLWGYCDCQETIVSCSYYWSCSFTCPYLSRRRERRRMTTQDEAIEAMISSIKQNTKLTLADEYGVNASQIIVTVTVNDTIVNGTDTTFVFDIGVDISDINENDVSIEDIESGTIINDIEDELIESIVNDVVNNSDIEVSGAQMSEVASASVEVTVVNTTGPVESTSVNDNDASNSNNGDDDSVTVGGLIAAIFITGIVVGVATFFVVRKMYQDKIDVLTKEKNKSASVEGDFPSPVPAVYTTNGAEVARIQSASNSPVVSRENSVVTPVGTPDGAVPFQTDIEIVDGE